MLRIQAKIYIFSVHRQGTFSQQETRWAILGTFLFPGDKFTWQGFNISALGFYINIVKPDRCLSLISRQGNPLESLEKNE
jgi:hypothetical protein